MDGSTHLEDTWSVAGRTFRSRLIVGTGKYKDYAQNAAAAEAAGAEIVTVALRRVNLDDPSQPRLTDHVSGLVDVQFQRWDSPATPSGHLWSTPVMLGARYRFNFNRRGYPVAP